MKRPENDTSASETDARETATDGGSDSTPSGVESDASANSDDSEPSTTDLDASSDDALTADPDDCFDALVSAGVLAEDERGVRTTDAFDNAHGVYYDSYVGIDDAEFHRSVAETFGLADEATAAQVVEAQGVTREDLARYLALRSELPADATPDELAVMAEMVGEVVPDTPVPADLTDVTDDPESFVGEHDRAVVAVWKRFCDPCDRMKEDLPSILADAREDVAFAGIDGEAAGEFCSAYEVSAAPGFVFFDGGERRETLTGYAVDDVRAALEEIYG